MQPLKRRNLYERIVEEVKSYIITNNLKPGDRLPTEFELAELLGVSRTSVREAMKALEMMGIVSTKPRVGCVVRSFDMKAIAQHIGFRLGAENSSLAELLEARQTLETAIIPLVIERANAEHLAKMEGSIQLYEKEIEQDGDGINADMMFHSALLAAAGNKVLLEFANIVRQFFIEYIKTCDIPRCHGRIISDHREIYNAIKNRDIDLACEALTKHLGIYTEYKLFAR